MSDIPQPLPPQSSSTPAPIAFEPTQDERTFATLAHALQTSCWWIAPLIIYFMKRESKFVAFHALQALFLQLSVLVFWFGAMFLFMATVFANMPLGGETARSAQPPAAIFLFFPLMWLGGMALFATVITLSIVYAIKAGRGKWAGYPLFGSLARRVVFGRAV